MTLAALPKDNANAWLLLSDDEDQFAPFAGRWTGDVRLIGSVAIGDWILLATTAGGTKSVGRIHRIRLDTTGASFFFDKLAEASGNLSDAGIVQPEKGALTRLEWAQFAEGTKRLCGIDVQDAPLISHQPHMRDLLQLAVTDDLLGPAKGPYEEIIDMGVRDRYLVGKLAPRELSTDGIEGLQGAMAAEVGDEPSELEAHTGRHDTGAEFDRTTGRVDAEADASDDIDAASNQSLVPSSFGFTFCIDGTVKQIEVEARWGRYVRIYEHEHRRPVNRKIRDEHNRLVRIDREEVPAKVWQREPCGGAVAIDVQEGAISHTIPDAANPEVRVQGTIRPANANGDRLITLFLVNTQTEPNDNKDAAWVFQPELIVRAVNGRDAIFRKRITSTKEDDDPERKSLDMIYRTHVEFASGHGIAVHAVVDPKDAGRAMEIRSVVIPQYEVPITETPGLRAEDRSAMKQMVENGHLDMQVLADLERSELTAALSTLIKDYAAWIEEQTARVGKDVQGFDAQAEDALAKCAAIKARLEEGVAVLADPKREKALAAFRFMNRAMASQRVHSLYALARRRGENKAVADFDIRRNRSWRPFQLAFILLAIPALDDPRHADRTKPLEAYADLLWFPTGGGKTEAYLGVAAFAMAIRRMQGALGGLDGSRGLSVIMRYTLRLLTLQQFQRASALICAMEVLRQAAIAAGDTSLGAEAFTIGLWVGNKVTPGTTSDSQAIVKKIRDPERFDPGGATPAQLTSCPWCGSEIRANRDIEVNVTAKRTTLYCGDPLGACEFAQAKSNKLAHPGLPVLVVDEELYHRPPSMMIATVDKFAMMAWRGDVRTLFGRANTECPRHGLLWPDADCTGNHPAKAPFPKAAVRNITPLRPPDLIIQDEFHLISGPLGTMVGLYETAINELCSWKLDDKVVQPKVVASTATVRKATEQVNNVFMRRVSVFPPHGLDVADNFFSVQRSTEALPGRRYMGLCSPGSSRPAVLIRAYTAFLTASQALFNHFGSIADPYLTTVGYFNSLRELGGMKRLAEDDVRTRAYRVRMGLVDRPGLAQRNVTNVRELTSRVSSRDIPTYLDQLEVKFKAEFDTEAGAFVTNWNDGELRALDVVLATNMLSVGVDVNRIGLMVVNGQPKGTAEYIQATSRVGRAFPGLVCTVLTWARPRDLSHYETFEHYHATFYKHVEAQSVTPFAPRAMDRGLTGTLLSMVRLENPTFNPNTGAGALDAPTNAQAVYARNKVTARAWDITHENAIKDLAASELMERLDEWASEAAKPGRVLAYEKKGPNKQTTVALLRHPGLQAWDNFTVPMSMREVEPGVRLIMSTTLLPGTEPPWTPRTTGAANGGDDA